MILKLFLSSTIITFTIVSCTTGDYHDDWSIPNKVSHGKYYRSINNKQNNQRFEAIEILNDSNYIYYFKDALTNDTITGTYQYIKAIEGDNHYSYVQFQGLSLPYNSGRNTSTSRFTALYGTNGKNIYLDPSPELETDLFVLRK